MKRQFGPTPNYPLAQKYKDGEHYLIGGPCSVESVSQIQTCAKVCSQAGFTHLRGGTFRAGTYPPENFGLIDEGLLSAFKAAADYYDLENIVEVLDYRDQALGLYEKYSHCFQVGARQMQNYTLLRVLSEFDRTVFLKRSPSATIDETLGAVEYLLKGRCQPVIIERGSVSFTNHVRWDLSVSMIAAIKAETGVPIIVDASHGSGRRDLVTPLTLAGLVAGADGCLVEFHPKPDESISDSEQALSIDSFSQLAQKIKKLDYGGYIL